MKLSKIDINNFCGLRYVKIAVTAPVLMIAAHNGAGKSSLLDAIKLAVTGEPSRVVLKGDYGQMIKEGSKTGDVAVTLDGRDCTYDLKAKKGVAFNHADEMPAMPYVLDATLFAKASLADRRNLLSAITGSTPTPELIIKRLLERGCESTLVEVLKPVLRLGFEASHKEAKNKQKEARGAWGAVTGETYGDLKGGDWKAPRPEFVDEELLAKQEKELAILEADHDSNTQQIGALEQQWRDANNAQAQVTALQEKADLLKRRQDKKANDEKELDRMLTLIASLDVKECPCCQARLITKGGELLQAGLSGLTKELPNYIQARDMFMRAIANDVRDIAESQAAQEQLKNMGALANPALMLPNIESLRIRINAMKAERATLKASIHKLQTDKRALEEASTKESNAATYHANIQAWGKIADALAPEGIQSDLLVGALKKVNARLRQSADDTDWFQISVGADMAITASGRPYNLLSESEKWRADAHLTEMISHLSGLKLMVLDRMDVLGTDNRNTCVQWLDILADEGDVDTIVVAVTLKEKPKSMPASYQVAWIADGEVVA